MNARRSARHCTSLGSSSVVPIGCIIVDRLGGSDARPQDVLTLDLRQERNLGDLGPEHLARVVEQGHERPVDLRTSLQDPGGLVEHLEAFVLLTLRDVRPVGDEDAAVIGTANKQGGGRLDEQDGDHEQREAGVRERDHRHPSSACVGSGHAAAHPRRGRSRRSRRRRRPCSRPRSPGRPSASRAARSSRCTPTSNWTTPTVTTEHRRNWARLNASLTDRWRRLMTSGQAGPDQAGDDELPRCEEEDPVDDRDLAHRERVGASADVEMDDLGFRQVEDGGQHPPRQRDRGLAGGPAGSSTAAIASAIAASTAVSAHTRAVPVVDDTSLRTASRPIARFSWRAVTMARSASWASERHGLSRMLCRWPDPAGFMQSLALDTAEVGPRSPSGIATGGAHSAFSCLTAPWPERGQ